ncbi:RICIN domain-containing protein [Streptomyces sp. MS1.HAVA.3]|uniref:RICIN domain-containing protein n=1 Tax=Streptomyces caledonius TaxID=3134107 RepID=A0ABU8UBV9_9ACTN
MSQIRTVAALAAAVVLACLIAAFLAAPPARPGAAASDTVVTAAASVPTTGTLGNQAKAGGPVSREQVIQRAQAWVDQKVPYNSARSWSDKATGGGWRQDCSGFVSMAWMLPASETTHTLPRLAKQISISELRPGDILNSPAHVLLFGGWTDKGKRTFTYYQESNPRTPTNKATGSLTADRLAGHPRSTYTALRYVRIVDEAAAPPPPAQATVPSSSSPPAQEPKPKVKPSVSSSGVAVPSRSAGPAAPPASVVVAAGPRTWVNAGTRMCLEIRRDAVEDGAAANQWTCNNSPTQKWDTTNPTGWTTIVNVNSGKCLEIRRDAVEDGAGANQWTCNKSPTQSWRWQAMPGGGWSLVNANSGKCLTIRGQGDGALADQQPCDGTPTQTWH